MSFTAGTQVGPYRIIEQLGQGGMATVYKAYHPSLDRYVAIKVLHQAFLEDASFHARFQREARVVARLEHPNIVPIYDYAEYDGQPYLVMKFIEGDTLKARMQSAPLTSEEVIYITESVGAGLAYAHRQGILHRDIKPSNVIIANDNQIYLADFGLARIAQSGESTLTSDMVLGTPHYISPEQAMAKKDLDEGTDIYSFGVMLYEMTVGRVPYSADTPFSIIHDHIYSPLPLPSKVNPAVSPAVERVLLKALAKDRADRYADVVSLVAAFKEAWVSGVPAIDAAAIAAPKAAPTESASSADGTLRVEPQAETPSPAVPQNITEKSPVPQARWRWWWLLVILPIVCVCCLVAFFFVRNLGQQNAPHPPNARTGQAIETPAPEVDVTLDATQATVDQEDSINLAEISLDKAKQLTEQRPRDARARFIYGFALLEDDQDQAGYDEIKREANLAGRNQILLLGAANAFASKEMWLAATLIYVHIAENLRVMPANLIEDMRQAVYYGFAEEDAPDVVSYETLDGVDHTLALIAQAHYTLVVLEDDTAAQKLLAELDAGTHNFEETQLLRAELSINQGDDEAAKPILQALIAGDNTPAWIKEEAQSILSDIE